MNKKDNFAIYLVSFSYRVQPKCALMFQFVAIHFYELIWLSKWWWKKNITKWEEKRKQKQYEYNWRRLTRNWNKTETSTGIGWHPQFHIRWAKRKMIILQWKRKRNHSSINKFVRFEDVMEIVAKRQKAQITQQMAFIRNEIFVVEASSRCS